jgi:hypothetical protein
MSWEQLTALVLAISALLGAFATVLVQIGNLRRDLNGRLQELLLHAVQAARKEGELAGRDFVRAEYAAKDTHSEPSHDLPA